MHKVSAIINTKSRPVEVVHAIRSVLAQTFQPLEIIVVVDGPEAAVEHALAEFQSSFAEPVFRVVVNPTNLGISEARNVGVRECSGEYVAFLDDDDEWLPAKIEHQLRLAEALNSRYIFVGCRFTERNATYDRIWPETLPTDQVHFSEFLYVQRGMLVPCTFLASRALMENVPFTRGLSNAEDIDWMLRAASWPGTRVAVTEEVLAIYNNQSVANRASRNIPWYTDYIWSLPNVRLFTPLAYSCFITRGVVPRAKLSGATMRELLHLFSAALLLGSINLKAVFSFFFSVFLTPEQKTWGKRILSRRTRVSVSSSRGSQV